MSCRIEIQRNLCWYEASSLKETFSSQCKNLASIFIASRHKINIKNYLQAFEDVGHPVGLSVTHSSRVKLYNKVTVRFSGEGNTISASAS
jgi:hypothetical protein